LPATNWSIYLRLLASQAWWGCGLGNNQITDISPLAGLANLQELSLDGNGISNVSALEGLPSLILLGLSSNQISDIKPLGGQRGAIRRAMRSTSEAIR
jgi:Leucine-rich repeat (LRR) protein